MPQQRQSGRLVVMLWVIAVCLVGGIALPIAKIGWMPRHAVGIVVASISVLVAIYSTIMWAACRREGN